MRLVTVATSAELHGFSFLEIDGMESLLGTFFNQTVVNPRMLMFPYNDVHQGWQHGGNIL